MAELKKYRENASDSDDSGYLIVTKEFILALRDHLNISKVINELLFGDMDQKNAALVTLKFYNQVKKILVRSSNSDKKFLLPIFKMLLDELRVKLDITNEGIGPDKIISEVYGGLDEYSDDGESDDEKV